jgi:hypothetical protein
MTPLQSTKSNGLILFACFALAAVGLAVVPRAPQGTTTGPDNTFQTQTPKPASQFPTAAVADSNNSMIAVTGVDLTGSSVLYLVDTVNRQIAVYQATGGGASTQGIKLVGARRIDLDMQLYGYNDKSDLGYLELQKQFADLPPANAAAQPVR